MLEFSVKAIIADTTDMISSATIYLFNEEQRLLLPIKMPSFAADNIILAKEGKTEARPHMHDTITRIIKALRGKVENVIISGYQNEIYYSYIRVQSGKDILDIDSKPSDSIAVALRLGVPIMVPKHVCNSVAIKVTPQLLEKSLA